MDHIASIRAALGELDAILLTGESNCFYATGFMGEGVTVVTRQGAVYITDSRYTEAAQNAIGSAAQVWEMNRDNPLNVLLSRVFEEANAKNVGFEDGQMTVAQHTVFSKALPCTLVPATRLLTALRGSKDENEIAAMVAAQRIAEGALDKLLGEITVGMTEKEIAARLHYLMVTAGAEKLSFDTIVASGPNSSMPHAVPTERRIENGDFLTIDFGCVYHGYCSDMTRTFAVGSVSDEMRRVYDTVLQAQLAGIAAARAGVSGKDIDGAAREVIEKAGYGAYFGHSFGHSLGIDIHENPNASPGNTEPMPVGAVISAEPGIYLPGRFGVRIEDVLVLNEDGCRNITAFAKELTVI